MFIKADSPGAINQAVLLLKKGGVVICPTDTVYGFLADATNKKAVDKIYKIKKRPKSKKLPVFVKDFKMAESLVEINERQAKILTLRDASGQGKFWPGKYTFILKRKTGKRLYGVDKKTIALRIPNSRFLNNLLKKIDRPLVQTSVNIYTQEPLKNIDQIIATFGQDKLVSIIIDGGEMGYAKPSKILDLTRERLTRLR